jgi:HlyD family secretion protein
MDLMPARPLPSLFVLFALGASPALAASAEPPAPRAPVVMVVTPTRAELVEIAQVTGTLVAREEILVGPEIEGLRIVEILVEEGDKVAAGQTLARLSRETLDAQLAQSDAQIARSEAGVAQARAAIAQAEAALAQSGPALDRAKTLARTGAGTDAALDQREAEHKANQARLVSAQEGLTAAQADRKALEAARRELDVRVARTQVKAPASGVVSRRGARLGAIATAASPEPMFRLVADGAVELEAEAPDYRLARMRIGQPARVVDAAGKAHAGAIRLVSPEIDRLTRMGKLRVSTQADSQLRVGGFARGEIETDRRVGLTLPASAVLQDKDGSFVETVVDGRVRRARVSTGLNVDGRIEIMDGLSDAAAVVSRAGAFLNDGDQVEIRDERASLAPGAATPAAAAARAKETR